MSSITGYNDYNIQTITGLNEIDEISNDILNIQTTITGITYDLALDTTIINNNLSLGNNDISNVDNLATTSITLNGSDLSTTLTGYNNRIATNEWNLSGISYNGITDTTFIQNNLALSNTDVTGVDNLTATSITLNGYDLSTTLTGYNNRIATNEWNLSGVSYNGITDTTFIQNNLALSNTDVTGIDNLATTSITLNGYDLSTSLSYIINDLSLNTQKLTGITYNGITDTTFIQNNFIVDGTISINTVSNPKGAFYNGTLSEGVLLSANDTITEIKLNNQGTTHFSIQNTTNNLSIINSSSSANSFTTGSTLLNITSSGNMTITDGLNMSNTNITNVNTITGTTGNITTSNITTATIATGNITTSNITTATINTANIGTLYLNGVNVASRLNDITNLQTRVGRGTMSLNYTFDNTNFRTASLSYIDSTFLRTLNNGFLIKTAGLFYFSFGWKNELQLSLGGYEDITRFNYVNTSGADYLTLSNLYGLSVSGGGNFNNQFDNHGDNPKVRYKNIKDANGNFSWDITTKYNDDFLQRRGNGYFVTFTIYLNVNETFFIQFKAGNDALNMDGQWYYNYLSG